jgi:hypothetical protein
VIATNALVGLVARHLVASRGRATPVSWITRVGTEILTEALGVPCLVDEGKLTLAIREQRLILYLVEGRTCAAVDLSWRAMPMVLGKGSLLPPEAFVAKARALAGMQGPEAKQ